MWIYQALGWLAELVGDTGHPPAVLVLLFVPYALFKAAKTVLLVTLVWCIVTWIRSRRCPLGYKWLRTKYGIISVISLALVILLPLSFGSLAPFFMQPVTIATGLEQEPIMRQGKYVVIRSLTLEPTTSDPQPRIIGQSYGEKIKAFASFSAEPLDTDGDQTRVYIWTNRILREFKGTAHIHKGTCKNFGPVWYHLDDIKVGQSMTILDISKKQLAAQAPFSVDMHIMADNENPYLCGSLIPPRPWLQIIKKILL